MSNGKRPGGGNASARGRAARAEAAKIAADQRAARESARRRRLLAGVTAGALLVGGGVTYLTKTGGSPSGVTAASGKRLPPLEVEPGVQHVHGLGVDPADDTLYAATHSGLFRLPKTGTPVRVANRAQDTMGFSIVGPGKFIGSGHPDFREDDVRPPLLGLIESTDRGESWLRLSLHGKADFHALHAAHGLVYGYDSTSQTFMVSKDRKEWDRRAKLPMRDFAVSPTDPDTIFATSERGLVRSSNGGRTWQEAKSAPVLAVLAWAQQDALYGVAPDGAVHQSADGGASWTERGNVGGEPEAFAIDARDGKEALYVASNEGGIVSSADGGKSFTTIYKE